MQLVEALHHKLEMSWFGFPMVSLEYFIDKILLVLYGPAVVSASYRNEYQEYFLSYKGTWE